MWVLVLEGQGVFVVIKSGGWSRGNGGGAGIRVGVVGVLDELGVMGLRDEILEGDIKCGTCDKLLCIKKLLYYHGGN